MTGAMNNALTRLWDWIDTRGVIRRLVLAVTIWATIDTTRWAATFANRALELDRVTTQAVAMVGAVTALVAALGGYVFKLYLDSRGGSS